MYLSRSRLMEMLDRLVARFRLFLWTHLCKVKQGILCYRSKTDTSNTVAALLKIPGLECFHQNDAVLNLSVFKNIRFRHRFQKLPFFIVSVGTQGRN